MAWWPVQPPSTLAGSPRAVLPPADPVREDRRAEGARRRLTEDADGEIAKALLLSTGGIVPTGGGVSNRPQIGQNAPKFCAG